MYTLIIPPLHPIPLRSPLKNVSPRKDVLSLSPQGEALRSENILAKIEKLLAGELAADSNHHTLGGCSYTHSKKDNLSFSSPVNNLSKCLIPQVRRVCGTPNLYSGSSAPLTKLITMLRILAWSHPFEVIYTVISFNTIPMIYLALTMWIFNKRFCNETMDKNVLLLSL